ncbi:hypothetical protein [Alicyclobacillus sp. SO9]|uniref:hypothetical protein n=1 Tax=Alicyclobacillus sp. SO9 TaxID=2665646 RepID=UPI0018E7B16F|nr:hypothetical protein [Alicyclobacillus sp. SO9]QQE78902.1 hypothetical protein GI364_24235 [Alicyclobacillus sp. SO9]
MLWTEVREIFPNQFVLMEDLKSYVEDGQVHVEEVAVIRPLVDGKEASHELRECKGNKFICHTSKPEIVMHIRSKPNLRG